MRLPWRRKQADIFTAHGKVTVEKNGWKVSPYEFRSNVDLAIEAMTQRMRDRLLAEYDKRTG